MKGREIHPTAHCMTCTVNTENHCTGCSYQTLCIVLRCVPVLSAPSSAVLGLLSTCKCVSGQTVSMQMNDRWDKTHSEQQSQMQTPTLSTRLCCLWLCHEGLEKDLIPRPAVSVKLKALKTCFFSYTLL